MSDRPNRFYSKRQETRIAQAIGGKRTPNSGATVFDKGDVKGEDILVEAKTVTKPQKSVSIQKAWIEKNQEEAFARGKALAVVAFDFGDGQDYYILRSDDFQEMYKLWLESRRG